MKVDDYRKAFAAELDQERAAATGWTAQSETTAGLMPPNDRARTNERGLSEEGTLLEAQIAALGDRRRDPIERIGAMRGVQAATFLGSVFDRFRADYRRALRIAATDEHPPLREAALEVLASDRDVYATELLREGLERNREPLISDGKAIQLLAIDDHGVAIPLARKLIGPDHDVETRIEALRVLATDPGSVGLLYRVLTDRGQPNEMRSISATGLRLLAPGIFEETAGRIAMDPDEPEHVRAACFGALAHGPTSNASGMRDLMHFAERVSLEGIGPVQAAATRFLNARAL